MKDIRNVHTTNPQGSITVFLSLILFTIVSFIFLLIDATRINSAKNQLVIASDNAAESAMSEFNKILFDEYGLFAFDGTVSQDTASRVFSMNIDPNFGASTPKDTVKILDIEGDSIIRPMALLFDGTDVFKQQMIYAMKYQGTENLAVNVFDKIKGLIGAAEQASISEDIKDVNDGLNDIKKQLAKVEEAKLSSQRAIIGLTLANSEPEISYLNKFEKKDHFDPQIKGNDLLITINENIGKLYFAGTSEEKQNKKDKDYIKYPYQNIYAYKYVVHMINAYGRTFEEEYNKEKAKYDAEITKYENALAQYKVDKQKYEKAMADYERDMGLYETYQKELKEYEEEKAKNPDTTATKPTEVTKPTKPTMKNPEEPKKPNLPEILKMDLKTVKEILNKFNKTLNEKSLEIAKNTVDDDSLNIGNYIKELDEGKKAVDTLLIDKKVQREEILKKLEELKSKSGSSDLSGPAKAEIDDLYTRAKNILDETKLNELSRSIADVKAELIRFRTELYDRNTGTSKLIKSIDSIINSSTTKIESSKSTVGPFMEKIYTGIYTRDAGTKYSDTYVEPISLVQKTFINGSNLLTVPELSSFRKDVQGIHADMNILENINEKVIKKDSIDIGNKDDVNKTEEEVLSKLEDAGAKDNEGTSLKAILANYASEETLNVILALPGTGGSAGKEGGVRDFEALTGYKDAFAGESYDKSMLDKIYITEYIMTNFKDMVDYVELKNRTPRKTNHESQLNYEIEAIVRANGVYDDKKNKEAMKDWIKNIRIACNTITIMNTKKMMDFTYKVAKATSEIIATGFTLFVPGGAGVASVIRSKPFIKIIQFGLIISWANMESNLDAADIFRGFYVPLIKKPDQWIMTMGLDLENSTVDALPDEIDNAVNNTEEPSKGESEPYNEQPDEKTSDGVAKKLLMANYPDYLRARLLIKLVTDEDSVINATKDLVYANMEKVVGGEFNYNNYYTGMEISVDSSVNTWFKNDAFGSGGKVNFNKFTYKKRYN